MVADLFNAAMNQAAIIPFEKPATLRARVAQYLRDAIMQGQLVPGERLREQEWCEQLQISRSTLREALRTLEAERLIVIEPHRGPSVASMSEKAARDIYAMRAVLESYAAREFALQADAAQVQRLTAAAQALHVSASRADRSGLLAAKQVFYDVLLEGCGNRVVGELLPGLLSRINLLRATSFSRADRTPESLREIDQIVRAIQKRDAEGAERATKRHILKAEKAALAVMAKTRREVSNE